jgi:pyridoxamine 5'-phosphate oxidase-like protein
MVWETPRDGAYSRGVATWGEFAAAEPDLATRGQQLLLIQDPEAPNEGGLGYLATVRGDGGPRVHPISPALHEGRLYAFIVRTSPKRADLLRDGRYALHSWPLPFEADSFNDEEFYLAGRARLVEDETIRARIAKAVGDNPATGEVFELDMERVMHKSRPGGTLTYAKWPRE